MTGPHELWKQAGGGTPEYDPERYRELLEQHGHIVSGPPQPLPCGHDLIGPSPQQRIDGMGSDPTWDEAIANAELSAMTADTWRDQITEAIDDKLRADIGLSLGSFASGQIADAVMPILDAALAQQAEDIAQEIFDDEQKCQAVIVNDPTNAHLNGRLVGLQRARDIARNAGGQP